MRNDQWTNYWKSGVATSFGSESPPWYERTINPFWIDVFSGLEDGEQILDLASGNGAVARIAARLGAERNKHFKITAVDKSILAPAIKQDPILSSVEFVSGMPLEKLQLDGQSFGLIVSQFGLEYSSLDKSLPNLSRIMLPGGELVILAHNVDSVISRRSRLELQQYREILARQPLFEKLTLLLNAMGEIRSKADLKQLAAKPAAEKQRIAFNRVISKLMNKYPEGVVMADLLSRINPLFREKVNTPVSAKLDYVRTLEREFKQAEQRLTDLLNAAMDKQDMRRFLATSGRCGLELVSAGELTDEAAGLLAWAIRLKRTG